MSKLVGALALGGAAAAVYYLWTETQRQQDEAERARAAQFYQANMQAEQAKQARKAAILSPGSGGPANPWAPLLEWGIGEIVNGVRSAPRGGGLGGFLDKVFGGKGGGKGGGASSPPAQRQSAPVVRPASSGGGYSGTGPGGVDFGSYERKYKLPGGYLERTAQIESGMNPKAKNPRSSAGGLFQFINSTAREYGLADRYDPAQATDAASRLASDNASRLRRTLGREPTGAELYLAHQQGGAGAARLLSNPNAPATQIVGSSAVKLNGGRSDMTAGEFAGLWINKFNKGRS